MAHTIIKNKKELNVFVKQNDDSDPEATYIAMNKKGECFAIFGCTYATESFNALNNDFSLVISDMNYTHEINEQSSSKYPESAPFFLKKSDKVRR